MDKEQNVIVDSHMGAGHLEILGLGGRGTCSDFNLTLCTVFWNAVLDASDGIRTDLLRHFRSAGTIPVSIPSTATVAALSEQRFALQKQK